MLETPIRIGSSNMPAVQILSLPNFLNNPISHHIHDKLRPYAKHIIPSDDRYTLMFDKFEILMSLSLAYKNSQLSEAERDQAWIFGGFRYRTDNIKHVMEEMDKSLWTEQDALPFVESGIFGETAAECRKIRTEWQFWIEALIKTRQEDE